ncbi:hypothetical protein [Azospirillum melinis]
MDRADIVVVGAGILGLAVAWALGQAPGSGARPVLVVDLALFALGRLGPVDPFSQALRDACAAARSGKTAG